MIAIDPEDWIRVAAADSVDFVGSGGALVRFVVGLEPPVLEVVHDALRILADESNLFFLEVEAFRTRIQYPNAILEAVADQLDFRQIMTSFLLELIVREGYDIPTGAKEFVLREVARINDLVPADVTTLLVRNLRSLILKDSRLVRDVRFALLAMASEILRGDSDGAIEVTMNWLGATHMRIKELRNFGIAQKVDRYNARSILRSLLTWLPASGRAGSILYVDAQKLAMPRPSTGQLFYSRSALLDAYEVMREFVDDADNMNNVMIVFAMSPEFLNVEPRGRGMGAYQALEYRVAGFTEQRLPNPLANLVELSLAAERSI